MSGTKYEFDEGFQQKVAALTIRDATFNLRTEGLIEPGYFINDSVAVLVSLAGRYWKKYKNTPSTKVLIRIVGEAIKKKIIRSDMTDDVKDALKSILKEDLSDRDYVVDEVSSFARHQAIIAGMEKSVPLLDDRDFDGIEHAMKSAFLVGATEGDEGHDISEDLDARTQRRKDLAVGVRKSGITTGCKELDDALSNQGFGRRELSTLLGPAKRGKSFGLMNFAVNAQLAGFNVLYVTLENSVDMTTDRIDAYLSQTPTRDILKNIISVEKAVNARLSKPGVGLMKIHEFSTGSFAPKDLRRLVERHRSKGILFDEIVIDYWDIMAPDVRYKDNKIEESCSIGVALRSIAQDENVAVVTAIQSNRDGFKAHTASAEHAAEDFNKVRIPDVLFSINATDDERAAGEARLYMAAVRNSEGGYQINIKQDLAKATFISGVIGRGGI